MIGQASATLWMVVHSVQGIMLEADILHKVHYQPQGNSFANCSVFGSSWHSSEFFFVSISYLLFISGMEMIGQALATLWMVVHSVQGIMFKDLKQILRKEQVDASILLTANVPAAKKIIVHGPQG